MFPLKAGCRSDWKCRAGSRRQPPSLEVSAPLQLIAMVILFRRFSIRLCGIEASVRWGREGKVFSASNDLPHKMFAQSPQPSVALDVAHERYILWSLDCTSLSLAANHSLSLLCRPCYIPCSNIPGVSPSLLSTILLPSSFGMISAAMTSANCT